MSSDVRDILDLEGPSTELTKESVLYNRRKIYNEKVKTLKRPEGMHREVFALLYNDNKDAPPLLPTDTAAGYIQVKARLGMKKVRKWEWSPFTNPARSDSAVFHHWRRTSDPPKDYPFAQFNKTLSIPQYTPTEYSLHLKSNTLKWSKTQTDHLFDLARRFDLRFVVIADRWDRASYGIKTVEDLKERYYEVVNALQKAQHLQLQQQATTAANAAAAAAAASAASGSGQAAPPLPPPIPLAPIKPFIFDAEHERKRKEQLRRLFDRTPKQIEEEQMLLNELKKIEARKRERDRKTQDLQKLISQADQQGEAPTGGSASMSGSHGGGIGAGGSAAGTGHNQSNASASHAANAAAGANSYAGGSTAIGGIGNSGGGNSAQSSGRKQDNKKMNKKKLQNQVRPSRVDSVVNAVETAGIKFTELRSTGISLRSQRMKLPANIGQKKAKALEMALAEFRVDPSPPPTDEICTAFNELRSDMVLLCELRTALTTCSFELESLKHQYEALCPGKTLNIPTSLISAAASPTDDTKPPTAALLSSCASATMPSSTASSAATDGAAGIDVVGSSPHPGALN